MPHSKNWEASGIYLQHWGVVTGTEIQEANDDFFSDPRSDKAKYQICDFLNVDAVTVDDMDLKHFAAVDFGGSQYLKKMKVALVTNRPDIHELCEGYIEISRRLQSSWDFKIFDNMADVRVWVVEK